MGTSHGHKSMNNQNNDQNNDEKNNQKSDYINGQYK